VASKAAQQDSVSSETIEEMLDVLDKTLDRVKVLYEQYFLGMQKQPPTHIHNDVERRLRDLMQIQIRNTGLRYRFATLQQKFGSYNTYWRRTLRQIENGTYHRNLAKVGRQAAQTGEAIPDEILAAMPKRMRDQVLRDRELALARKARHDQTAVDEEFPDEVSEAGTSPIPIPVSKVARNGAHVLDDNDGDFDVDAFFRSVINEEAPSPAPAPPRATPAPAPRATPAQAPRATPVPAPSAELFEADLTSELDELIDPPPRPAPSAAAPRSATPPAGVPVPTRGSAPRIAATPASGETMRRSAPNIPAPASRQSSPNLPPEPAEAATQKLPSIPQSPGAKPAQPAPSQGVRPLPVMPGASTQRVPVAVESMNGPFPRPPQAQPPQSQAPQAQAPQRPTPPPASVAAARTQPIKPQRTSTEPGVGAPRMGPPPGMTDADVNALYAKYVKAKEAVGEKTGPGAYGKLLQTINAQAPKIMEQYKAKGVDFQVVVKDNQVVIRAKPKT
jgi:hypothetical protein